MPLLKGDTPEVISENIRELRKSGYKHKQAIAIAMKHSRKGTGKKAQQPQKDY
jgi:hypothetical protein